MTTQPENATIRPQPLPENESEWVIDALGSYADECRAMGQASAADRVWGLRRRWVGEHRRQVAEHERQPTPAQPPSPLVHPHAFDTDLRPWMEDGWDPSTASYGWPIESRPDGGTYFVRAALAGRFPQPELDAAWDEASTAEQIDTAAEALTRLTEELADTAGRLLGAKGMKRLRQAHRALVATFPAPEPEPAPETAPETASRLLEELVSEIEGYLPANATSETLSELRVALYTWHAEEQARTEAPCPNAAVTRLVADLYTRMGMASRINLEHGLPPEARRTLGVMLQEAEAERAAHGG